MFTAIGRFVAWYPFNYPAMRRIARNNPTDVGKLIVYGYLINVGILMVLSTILSKLGETHFDHQEEGMNDRPTVS